MIYLNIIIRSLIFYLIIIVAYKIMGKREVGELSVMDFIVSIFLAQLASSSIEDYDDSIFIGLLPIILLVMIEFIYTKYTLKNNSIRKIVDGKPSVIINRGKVNFKEMLKQRYNLDDLLTQLRDNSIKSIEEVDYAILETNGNLSVFKKENDNSSTYPLPIIIDGKIQEDVLIQINKSTKWLNRKLLEDNSSLENIFYAFYKNNKLFIIKNKNIL